MKHKTLGILLVGSILVPQISHAATLEQIKTELNANQQSLSQSLNNKSTISQNIESFIQDISKTEKQILELQNDITAKINVITKKEIAVQKLNSVIADLNAIISSKATTLEEQEVNLEKTLRSQYSHGHVTIYEFLFRSDNLSQFMNRYAAYKIITTEQETMYKDLNETLNLIKMNEEKLLYKQRELDKELIELQIEKQHLTSSQNDLKAIKNGLENKKIAASTQLEMERAVINQLLNEAEELKNQAKQEKQRLEIEKAKKEQTIDESTTPIIEGNGVVDIAYKWLQTRGEGTTTPVMYSMPKRQLSLTDYGDCSAFTRRVYLDAGKGDIGFTTAQQLTNNKGYFSADLKELLPGDLMYFGPTGNHQYAITLPNGQQSAVSHVAIYVGHGKMIDLSSGVGTISLKKFSPGNKWSSYVYTRFIGFKRF